MLNNKLYDTLKWIALVLLPGLATLYLTLSGIWDLPNSEGVVGTLTAIDFFLGTLIGINHIQYQNGDSKFDGEVVKMGGDSARLVIDPADVANKDQLLLKVRDEAPLPPAKPKKAKAKNPPGSN